jgi:hypothetical protein
VNEVSEAPVDGTALGVRVDRVHKIRVNVILKRKMETLNIKAFRQFYKWGIKGGPYSGKGGKCTHYVTLTLTKNL